MSRVPRAELATLGFTYFTVGVTVAVTLADRDVPGPLLVTSAVIVHSATSILAFVAVSDAGGATLAGVLSGWLVASRFGVLAATLGTRLEASLPERVVAALNAFDPNVAMATVQGAPQGVRTVFWRSTGAMVGGWYLGIATGAVLGNILGDTSRFGLDVVFPAALLAIIGPAMRRGDAMVAGLAGAGTTIALFAALPAGLPIVLSVAGAGVGVAFARRSAGETQ